MLSEQFTALASEGHLLDVGGVGNQDLVRMHQIRPVHPRLVLAAAARAAVVLHEVAIHDLPEPTRGRHDTTALLVPAQPVLSLRDSAGCCRRRQQGDMN